MRHVCPVIYSTLFIRRCTVVMNQPLAMRKLSTMASIFLIGLAVVAICSNAGKGKEEQPRCQKQIEKQQQLSSCQQYLVDGSRMSPSSRMINEGSWREEFPKCCQQLEQLDTRCRCQAISQIVEKQRGGGELKEVEMQEMLQTAQSLPNLCRLKPKYCAVESARHSVRFSTN